MPAAYTHLQEAVAATDKVRWVRLPRLGLQRAAGWRMQRGARTAKLSPCRPLVHCSASAAASLPRRWLPPPPPTRTSRGAGPTRASSFSSPPTLGAGGAPAWMAGPSPKGLGGTGRPCPTRRGSSTGRWLQLLVRRHGGCNVGMRGQARLAGRHAGWLAALIIPARASYHRSTAGGPAQPLSAAAGGGEAGGDEATSPLRQALPRPQQPLAAPAQQPLAAPALQVAAAAPVVRAAAAPSMRAQHARPLTSDELLVNNLLGEWIIWCPCVCLWGLPVENGGIRCRPPRGPFGPGGWGGRRGSRGGGGRLCG